VLPYSKKYPDGFVPVVLGNETHCFKLDFLKMNCQINKSQLYKLKGNCSVCSDTRKAYLSICLCLHKNNETRRNLAKCWRCQRDLSRQSKDRVSHLQQSIFKANGYASKEDLNPLSISPKLSNSISSIPLQEFKFCKNPCFERQRRWSFWWMCLHQKKRAVE